MLEFIYQTENFQLFAMKNIFFKGLKQQRSVVKMDSGIQRKNGKSKLIAF
jgi:hypothetical protein